MRAKCCPIRANSVIQQAREVLSNQNEETMGGPLPDADYRPRVADAELADALRASGGVLIEGARGCGKTETARQQARSEVLLDTDLQARAAGLVAPDVLLDGDGPRLIDEWLSLIHI